jgi:Rieske Fe-S protein
MQRREFIKNSCSACLSFTVLSTLVTGCVATRYISGDLGKDGLNISKEEFKIKQKGGTAYTSFIIVRNDALQYPICVYRINENEYTALWMKCTHQGAELQASGDVLQCPAHGSEFNNKGEVTGGPAGINLKTFPVTVSNNELFIDLRKQS